MIVENDGANASILGVYKMVERPTRGIPTGVKDYAIIQVSDLTEVFLGVFASDEAVRTKEERNYFDGKSVIVTGRVFSQMPNDKEGPVAPCVKDIKHIRVENQSTIKKIIAFFFG